MEKIADTIRALAHPGMKPKQLIEAVKEWYSDASRKEIARAAFLSVIMSADHSTEDATIIGDDRLLCHPFVVGELALGSLRKRDAVLAFFAAQREAVIATHAEVMTVIARHAIFSMGIGYTDAYLLTSTLLDRNSSLCTRDKRLVAEAQKVGATLYPSAHIPH